MQVLHPVSFVYAAIVILIFFRTSSIVKMRTRHFEALSSVGSQKTNIPGSDDEPVSVPKKRGKSCLAQNVNPTVQLEKIDSLITSTTTSPLIVTGRDNVSAKETSHALLEPRMTRSRVQNKKQPSPMDKKTSTVITSSLVQYLYFCMIVLSIILISTRLTKPYLLHPDSKQFPENYRD